MGRNAAPLGAKLWRTARGPRRVGATASHPLPSKHLQGCPAPLFLPYRSWIASLWRRNFYVAACTRSYREYLAPIKHIDLCAPAAAGAPCRKRAMMSEGGASSALKLRLAAGRNDARDHIDGLTITLAPRAV